MFENTLWDPFIVPNGTRINSLVNADDFIFLSRSKTGLPNCLNTFTSYCKSWMLRINSKKTRIMIFQKRPKKSFDIIFNIGIKSIEIFREYTYLGTHLTPTGNFTPTLDHWIEKSCTPSLIYEKKHSLVDLILIPHPRFLTQWYVWS